MRCIVLSQVYKQVLVMPGEFDTIIAFYNRVFMPALKSYILQFSALKVCHRDKFYFIRTSSWHSLTLHCKIVTLCLKVKVCFYIAQFPVRWTTLTGNANRMGQRCVGQHEELQSKDQITREHPSASWCKHSGDGDYNCAVFVQKTYVSPLFSSRKTVRIGPVLFWLAAFVT